MRRAVVSCSRPAWRAGPAGSPPAWAALFGTCGVGFGRRGRGQRFDLNIHRFHILTAVVSISMVLITESISCKLRGPCSKVTKVLLSTPNLKEADVTGRTRPLTRRRRFLALSAFSALSLIGGFTAYVATAPTADASVPGVKDVTAVMFEWKFTSIATECTNVLGPLGYGYVQVSPPQEHIQGDAVVDLVPACQLQDRWAAGEPVRVQIHDRHLPHRRRQGDRGFRHQPHDLRIRHGNRGHVVLQVQLPRLVLRRGLPLLPDQHLQLRGPHQRPGL